MAYPLIPNTTSLNYEVAPAIPDDAALPIALTSPPSPTLNAKQIFAFWHSGIGTLPPYLRRNVISWYRRYSPLGWNIYVFDNVADSPLKISNFIDTNSPLVVPAAFANGTLEGTYAAQHTSDLIRYPLLLKYGGVYLDVGILLFMDLDWLWTNHITSPFSPYDFAGFTLGDPPEVSIVNFALICGPANPLVYRAHRILLKLWEGKTNTTGMHKHALVNHLELMHVPQEVVVDEGQGKLVINDEAMTDYAIQIQAMGSAQRWVDEEDDWNGPKYVKEKAWLYSMMDGAFAHEQLTSWSGQKQFDLLNLRLPEDGEMESDDQKLARKIVETIVGQSWCLKLGHGFSAKLFGGDTLGMLWRKQHGTDATAGTYAGWLRWAGLNCKQETPATPKQQLDFNSTMTGSLKFYLDKPAS